MTVSGELFMAEDRHVLADRLSNFLARRYDLLGRNEALARDIYVGPRTARNYFSGYWPGAHAWRGIVRRFGSDVPAAVFEPDIDETSAALAAEIRAMEETLETRKARLRAMAGGQSRVASTSNGAR